DVEQVRTLKPDLVLTSLTVPGHERIVDGLRDHGLPLLVIDPLSLDDVYTSIIEIAEALGVLARGRTLVAQMQAQMPPAESSAGRPKILVEWWPKPVIVPARDSWVTDIIELAGGINPCAVQAMKSVQVSPDMAREMQPDAIVMSWCGVEEKNYRADVVLRRENWGEVRAIQRKNVVAITEAFLGRPGPRLVEGYRALRRIIEGTMARDRI
ncbi:MAG: ABC transporter substrate-binding protein, partial [Stenotrophobium sp.]